MSTSINHKDPSSIRRCRKLKMKNKTCHTVRTVEDSTKITETCKYS